MSFRCTHGCVAVATHTDGDDVLIVLGTSYSLAEEVVDHLLIGDIVPFAILLAMACPLLMVACHWLVMGCTHHHSHVACSR